MSRHEHLLLLVWVLLTGFVSFGLFVAWHEGLLAALVATDRSRISVLIGLIYLLATTHGFRRTVYLSTQLNIVEATERLLRETPAKRLRVAGRRLSGESGVELPLGFVSDYAIDRAGPLLSGQKSAANPSGANLLELHAGRIASSHEHGWFVVDVMLKLGLLGTVIGFILMLGSVVDTAALDVGTMQKVLREMSYGMGTALYTTLAGLTGGLLQRWSAHSG